MKNLTQSVLHKILLLVALVAFQTNAMAQRASGIDVSRFQGTINWTSVRGAGYTFAWAQATRGAYLTNVNFVANMVNGKAAGVLMGAYHYAFPATNSATVEANYFWNLAGPHILADGKTFVIMLDIEHFDGHVGATSYSDWATQWVNNVAAKANTAGVNIKFVLYSSASFMCNFNSSLAPLLGSDVANYNGQNPQTGTPWSCCTSCNFWGGGAWDFWQYSSTGAVPGISGNVDMDVFNGTEAQLSTWVATTTGAPVISNVSAGNISDIAATITWNTDINSDSVVDYGLTTSYGTTVSNGTMVVNHSVNLSGLSPLTTYHYRVKSKNGAGQSSTSGDFTFATLPSGQVSDIIIDNTGAAVVVGSWSTGTSSTDKYGADYRYKSGGGGAAYLQYVPNIVTAGNYQVYEWHPQGANRTTGAQEIVTYNGGSQTFTVNQQGNGGTWNLLGTFSFAVGTGDVKITDGHTDTANVVMADAIKFVFVSPVGGPPNAPSGLSATAVGPTQINLAWTDNSTNENNFIVGRSTVSGGPYTDIVTLAANAVSHTDSGLTPGTTYFYVVRASNGFGSSANSNQASATTQSNNSTAGGRSIPGSVSVGAAFSASITMTNTGTATWTTASSYNLGSQTPQDNTTWGFNRVSLPGSVGPGQAVVFNFTATAPTTAGTYAFDWKMVQDGVGWFGQTSTGTIVVNEVPPNAPSGLSATAVGPTQINLAWTDNSANEANFVVARSSTAGGPYTDIATTAANATSYNNTGLTANTTYYYVVKGTNSGGASAFSNEASATTPNGIADIIVDNPSATLTGSWTLATLSTDKFGADYRYKSQGTGAAYVTFTPNILTAGGYAVYEWHPQGANRTTAAPETINYNGGSTIVNVNQTGGGGAWNLLGKFNFASGTAGYVRIADNIPDAGQVVMADAIKFVYVPAPTAPSGLTATAVSSSQINLAWTDNSTNEDNFIVARSTVNGGPYTDIATLAAETTSYNNTGLSAGTTYYYVVRSRNTTASSANSNQASATTQASTAVHVNSITMSWVASGNRWKARAVVNVKDASGNNVSGATVTGNFTGAFTNNGLSGATDASGNATITSTSTILHGTVTFTVTNITGTGLTYNSGANVVTSASETR